MSGHKRGDSRFVWQEGDVIFSHYLPGEAKRVPAEKAFALTRLAERRLSGRPSETLVDDGDSRYWIVSAGLDALVEVPIKEDETEIIEAYGRWVEEWPSAEPSEEELARAARNRTQSDL